MSFTVRLHGGPMHGEMLALPDGLRVLEIMKPDKDAVRAFSGSTSSDIPVRRGSYSPVSGSRHTDWEWDGWKNEG